MVVRVERIALEKNKEIRNIDFLADAQEHQPLLRAERSLGWEPKEPMVSVSA